MIMRSLDVFVPNLLFYSQMPHFVGPFLWAISSLGEPNRRRHEWHDVFSLSVKLFLLRTLDFFLNVFSHDFLDKSQKGGKMNVKQRRNRTQRETKAKKI